MKKKPESKPNMSKEERDRRKLLDVIQTDVSAIKQALKILYCGDKDGSEDLINTILQHVKGLDSLFFVLLFDQRSAKDILDSWEYGREHLKSLPV